MLRKSPLSNAVFVDRASEKALAQRTERHEADTQFLKCRQDLRLGLAPPQ